MINKLFYKIATDYNNLSLVEHAVFLMLTFVLLLILFYTANFISPTIERVVLRGRKNMNKKFDVMSCIFDVVMILVVLSIMIGMTLVVIELIVGTD